LTGLLRQSTFGRLAGYEDVNVAERLWRDPAMRWIVGGKAVQREAASASQMGRFETAWLTTEENLAALDDLASHWIDRVHDRREDRHPCPIGHFPDGGGGGAPRAVSGNPAADRWIAAITPGTGLTR